MKYHSQNLNESPRGVPEGSMFWHGRAWWKALRRELHWEWAFGKHAHAFHLTMTFGNGDGNDGVLFAAAIPFLFNLYIGVSGVLRCKETEVGFAIHNDAFWWYTFSDRNESRSDWPWWKKVHSWYFPWSYDWYSTEILDHERPYLAQTVWMEKTGDRRRKDCFKSWDDAEPFKKSVSETYNYKYVLKNGEVQLRRATVYADRMTWRMRWWPLLPFVKVRTSINVKFDAEVGEGTGSWKGGCTGCGYDLRLGETPLECLRRMEQERKFDR